MSRKPIHPFINKLAEVIRAEYELEAPVWFPITPDKMDIEILKSECNSYSEHDPLQLRLNSWIGLKNGQNLLGGYQCEYGKIICILEDMDQLNEIPLELWGRILRLFKEKNKVSEMYRVFLIASTSKREMPIEGQPFSPSNINGGYTYPCNKDSIVIYRAEDATRVLLHELFHAACCDNPELSLDEKEAETEAWAEFFYCAFISRGTPYILRDLVQRQSQYMSKQNALIKEHLGKKKVESHSFPWRYTIGKQEVWERWGIFDDNSNVGPIMIVGNSLRLTFPQSNYVKKREQVATTSTML